MPSFYVPGSETPPTGYLFDSSGLQDDVRYTGRLNLTAVNVSSVMIAVDTVSSQFGKVPLKDIGTAKDFTLGVPATGAANTAGIETSQMRFAFRATTSALTIFFNDPVLGPLSGTVILGRLI